MDLYVSVEEAKNHLRIDFTNKEDEVELEAIIEAAQDAVEIHINRPLIELESSPGKLRASINHAIKLMIGNLYANREPTSNYKCAEIPYSISFLLDPHRKLI